MKKYVVGLYHNSGEIDSMFETDSPETALNKWLMYYAERPMMANITCGSKEDCSMLYKAFIENKAMYHNEYWAEKRIGLEYDYVEGMCKEYLNGRKIYHSGSKEFYDSVHPFCLG